MSGSPPPDPSRDSSQLAGQRRKRSDTPPSAVTTPTTRALPAPVEYNADRYGERSSIEQRREQPTMQIAAQPVPYLPPLTFGAGPGISISSYAPPEPQSVQQQISPRATRKTKAHVASACINCKKKHLRCDTSRPCRRCVQQGKEDTCRDVEHKKRGRPPLKPEDPSVIARRAPGSASLGSVPDPSRMHHPMGDPRGFHISNYPPILPNVPPSIYGHHRAASRSSFYGGVQPHYAAPSIAPSHLTATAGSFSYATRPQSTSSTISTQPPSPYVPQPQFTGQPGARQIQPYTGYPFHPVETPPTTQPFFSSPIFPRDQVFPQMPPESHYSHGLQLPPIRQPQHSLSDSSIPQQRQTAQPPLVRPRDEREESGERDSKRPKMDIQGILGPRND